MLPGIVFFRPQKPREPWAVSLDDGRRSYGDHQLEFMSLESQGDTMSCGNTRKSSRFEGQSPAVYCKEKSIGSVEAKPSPFVSTSGSSKTFSISCVFLILILLLSSASTRYRDEVRIFLHHIRHINMLAPMSTEFQSIGTTERFSFWIVVLQQTSSEVNGESQSITDEVSSFLWAWEGLVHELVTR
ncbi:hypothetical protein EAF04_006572 [Stromatinia cepivora]|nr:hypothetical protein EAF04_006572 [Stromatinia cepivora]